MIHVADSVEEALTRFLVGTGNEADRFSLAATCKPFNQLGAGIAWEKPADLSSKDVLKRLGPSAVKAFLKIRELWELRDEDARQFSNGAFYELKKKARGTLDPRTG